MAPGPGLPLRGLAAFVTLFALAAGPTPAPAAPARQAERAVEQRLKARDIAAVTVRCAPAPRGAKRCAWTGAASGERVCRGAYVARRAKGRTATRSTGTRCTTPAPVLAPAAAAVGAPAAKTGTPVAPARPGPATPATPAAAATPQAAPAGPAPAAPPPPATPPAASGGDPAPAPSGERPRLFGFNDNAVRFGQVSAERDAELAAGAGATAANVTFDWRYAERTRGTIVWTEYDAIYRASIARGIQPIWSVMYAPRWAWDADVACATDCRVPPAETELAAWANVVRRIALRYPRSAAIEVWNEPNLTSFWKRPDGARYARLLAAAYDAVKAVAPDMTVLGGALSNNQRTADGNVSIKDFTAAMYDHGAKGHMDGFAFHAYPWALDLGTDSIWDRTFRQVRAVKASHGDAATPLWITESGLSTSGLDLRYAFSEAAQADGLVDQYRAMAAMPDVAAILFHTLIEPPGALTTLGPGYGVVRQDTVTPKLAYCALAAERGVSCGA